MILKEALNVIHNETKTEKNSPASLPPPLKPSVPPFLTRLYGCAGKRQRAGRDRATERASVNETRAVEK